MSVDNGSSARPRERRALIEVSPDVAKRFSDPRLVLAVVAGIAGVVAIFAGYLGVSGTLDPAKQLPYLISGGIGGLFLLGVAAALVFSADIGSLRDDISDLRETLDRVEAKLDALGDAQAAEPVAEEPLPAARARKRRSRTPPE